MCIPFRIITIFLILVSFQAKAAKTDTITLYNGDRATCEVIQLNMGIIKVKTSNMGTLNIKWYKVASIETKQVLEIVLQDRTKIYGRLNKVDSAGYVMISSGMMIEEVYHLMEIVSINQVATNFWKGLDGSISYGLSFAKGTDNLQSNFAASVRHRSSHFLNRLEINSIISDNASVVSRKQDVTYSLFYYFRYRTFASFTAGWQQNTELGVDNRILSGLSLGYIAAQSNSNLLKVSGGFIVNSEYTNENTTQTDIEGMFSATYDLFLFAQPKISLSTYAIAYPSLTSLGRLRSDINFQLSWEIFSDFKFGVSFYVNTDNEPKSSTAEKLDYGYTTSIGYTF